MVSFSGFLKGTKEEKLKVAKEIFNAFEQVGFVYIKDYPLLTDKVKDIFKLVRKKYILIILIKILILKLKY